MEMNKVLQQVEFNEERIDLANKVFNLRNWTNIAIKAIPDDYEYRWKTADKVTIKADIAQALRRAVDALYEEALRCL